LEVKYAIPAQVPPSDRFIASLTPLAQNADEAKVKEQRRAALVEQILAEIPNLRLGENRAIVDVRVGNLLWDSDQKRARSLFQNAITELVNAQTQAEANQKPTTYQNELLTGQTTRPRSLIP
jgi:hypothetical protein